MTEQVHWLLPGETTTPAPGSDHPVDCSKGDPCHLAQKSSLDISHSMREPGASGLDYTKVFEGWDSRAQRASSRHGNSELGTMVSE